MVTVEYLAGFIDGEAYLGLARIPRRNGSAEYCIRLSIYNTDRPVLDEIRRTWGGTLSIVARKLPVWKTSYALIWTNAAAASVVGRVAPFLIVKSDQARALLEFDRRIKATRRSRDRLGHLLPLAVSEVKAREAVYLKLKRMNRRGASARPGERRRLPLPGGRKPSEEYVAGFIDAEGSLMITKGRSVGWRSAQYRPRIAVSNTKKSVLQVIQRAYGGILFDQPARNPRWRPSFQLIWTDRSVEPLLSTVAPHLRVKAPQARIMAQFIRARAAMNRVRGHQIVPKGSAKAVDSREVLQTQLKELNRKGMPVAS